MPPEVIEENPILQAALADVILTHCNADTRQELLEHLKDQTRAVLNGSNRR